MNPKLLVAGGAVAISVAVPIATLSGSSEGAQVQAVQQQLDLVATQTSDSLDNTESSTASNFLSNSGDLNPRTEGLESTTDLSPSSNNPKHLEQVTVKSEETNQGKSFHLDSSSNQTGPSILEKSGSPISTTKSPALLPPSKYQSPEKNLNAPKYVGCKEIVRDKREGKLMACYNEQDNKVKFSFVEFTNSLSGQHRVDGHSYSVGKLSFISSSWLRVEVLGIHNGVRRNVERDVWMPLSTVTKDFSYTYKNKGQQIDKSKCFIDWVNGTRGEKSDWKVNCPV